MKQLYESQLVRLCLSQLILVPVPGTIFGQQSIHTHQQRFTVDQGLPQNFISGLAQDEDGFIWLATMDGLCRYDGREFRIN